MSFKRVHYLPILTSAWFPITFTITYTIAVSDGHVSSLFPTISDTGTFSPESCMFGQMLNLGAVFMVACCYIKYLQIQELKDNNCLPDSVDKLNWYSLIMAMLASSGIGIVGNFQENKAPLIHYVGAFLAFGIGWIYFSLQTYISFKIYPLLCSKRMIWFRAVLSIGVIAFFVLLLVFGAATYLTAVYCSAVYFMITVLWKNFILVGVSLQIATLTKLMKNIQRSISGSAFASEVYYFSSPRGNIWKTYCKPVSDDVVQKVYPGISARAFHAMSPLSEWILTTCEILFIASLAHDFKYISLTLPCISNKLK